MMESNRPVNVQIRAVSMMESNRPATVQIQGSKYDGA